MSNIVEIKVPGIGDFADVDVIDVLVKASDTVAEEDALITLESSDKASMDIPSPQAGKIVEMKIAVGHTAAFRAAGLGLQTVLVERWQTLGGVCLNVGCIPSKAQLHAAKVLDDAEDMGAHGIKFAKPELDIDTLRGWKDGVVSRLTGGLAALAKQRKVQVVRGVGRFLDSHRAEVTAEDGR